MREDATGAREQEEGRKKRGAHAVTSASLFLPTKGAKGCTTARIPVASDELRVLQSGCCSAVPLFPWRERGRKSFPPLDSPTCACAPDGACS